MEPLSSRIHSYAHNINEAIIDRDCLVPFYGLYKVITQKNKKNSRFEFINNIFRCTPIIGTAYAMIQLLARGFTLLTCNLLKFKKPETVIKVSTIYSTIQQTASKLLMN
jgi:hypothetical protein